MAATRRRDLVAAKNDDAVRDSGGMDWIGGELGNSQPRRGAKLLGSAGHIVGDDGAG